MLRFVYVITDNIDGIGKKFIIPTVENNGVLAEIVSP